MGNLDQLQVEVLVRDGAVMGADVRLRVTGGLVGLIALQSVRTDAVGLLVAAVHSAETRALGASTGTPRSKFSVNAL